MGIKVIILDQLLVIIMATIHTIINQILVIVPIIMKILDIVGDIIMMINKIPEIVIPEIFSCTLHLNWELEHLGFGQLYIRMDEDAKTIHIDNENMSAEKVRAILYAAVDKIVAIGILDTEPYQYTRNSGLHPRGA
jgi:hypothetical protein